MNVRGLLCTCARAVYNHVSLELMRNQRPNELCPCVHFTEPFPILHSTPTTVATHFCYQCLHCMSTSSSACCRVAAGIPGFARSESASVSSNSSEPKDTRNPLRKEKAARRRCQLRPRCGLWLQNATAVRQSPQVLRTEQNRPWTVDWVIVECGVRMQLGVGNC